MMTKVLVYGYCVGVFSSRRIQKRLQEDIAFQGVGGGQRAGLPHDLGFPEDPSGGAAGVVRAGAGDGAGELGAVKRGAGVAGRDEGEGQRQQAQGDELRADAGEASATAGGSEAVAGAGRGGRRGRRPAVRGRSRGDELPEELQRRETRLAKIKQAKKVLEQRARDEGGGRRQERRRGQAGQAGDKDAVQLHRSGIADHEERPTDSCRRYNAQAAVEPTMELIVGPVGDAGGQRQRSNCSRWWTVIEAQSGQRPDAILADSGYCSEENLSTWNRPISRSARSRRTSPRGKQKHGELPAAMPARTAAEGGDAGGSDEAEAADQGGQGGVRGAQVRGRTGVRADQAGARISAILATRNTKRYKGSGRWCA